MQDAKTSPVGLLPALLFLLRVLIGALILTLVLTWVHGFWFRFIVGVLVFAIYSVTIDRIGKLKQNQLGS